MELNPHGQVFVSVQSAVEVSRILQELWWLVVSDLVADPVCCLLVMFQGTGLKNTINVYASLLVMLGLVLYGKTASPDGLQLYSAFKMSLPHCFLFVFHFLLPPFKAAFGKYLFPCIKMSLVDLGKRLLEAARKGEDDEVRKLMASGAPFTTDWVRRRNRRWFSV